MKQFVKFVLFPLFPPLRFLFFVLATLSLLLSITFYYALDNTAITNKNWPLSNREMQRAKNIIGNPSLQSQLTSNLTEKDLNIALNYLLNYYIPCTSEISIKEKQLQFKFSFLLPKTPFGNRLNFSFNLIKHAGYPVINTLQIGHIKVANEFAGLIIENLIKYSPLNEFYILAAEHIRSLDIHSQGISISYISTNEINLKTSKNLNNKNYNSVLFYQQKISTIIAKHDPRMRLSLAELLQPLFKFAFQRSTIETAIPENRAVLIAISTYVNKNEIQALIPFDIGPATQRQYSASLYKRTDMAKHFMISAVLAATAGESLADYFGQEKEITDSIKGSGFSFIDLAGDRAGSRFGKTAIESPLQARKIQKKMAYIKDYTAFMPEVRDLPENMSQRLFKKGFESVYSAKYQAMLKKIDNRIAKLDIYQ